VTYNIRFCVRDLIRIGHLIATKRTTGGQGDGAPQPDERTLLSLKLDTHCYEYHHAYSYHHSKVGFRFPFLVSRKCPMLIVL